MEERPGGALTTGGDEMTPCELTGKWKNGQQQTQFLYLSTSESEESLSSDLEAEEEQEREGWGGKRKGLTTLRKDRRVTDKGLKGGVTGKGVSDISSEQTGRKAQSNN